MHSSMVSETTLAKDFSQPTLEGNIHRVVAVTVWTVGPVLFIAFDVHIVDSIVHVSSFKE